MDICGHITIVDALTLLPCDRVFVIPLKQASNTEHVILRFLANFLRES